MYGLRDERYTRRIVNILAQQLPHMSNLIDNRRQKQHTQQRYGYQHFQKSQSDGYYPAFQFKHTLVIHDLRIEHIGNYPSYKEREQGSSKYVNQIEQSHDGDYTE